MSQPNFFGTLNGQQIGILLSEEERSKMRRGRGLHGTVTDLLTGKMYKVYGASCGLPNCMCAARFKAISHHEKLAKRKGQ